MIHKCPGELKAAANEYWHAVFSEANSVDVVVSKAKSESGTNLRRSRTGDLNVLDSTSTFALVFQRLVGLPTSNVRTGWDICSLVLVCYDCFVIPYQAFDPPVNDFSVSAMWFAALFWIADFIRNFFVGFFDHGLIEMRPLPFAKHYAKTWMVLDSIIILFDWLMIGISLDGSSTSTTDLLQFNGSLRILRFARLVRLLRLLRVAHVLSDLSDSMHAQYLKMGFQVVQNCLLVILIAHFIGCIWYAVGSSGSTSGRPTGWVEVLNQQEIFYRWPS